MASYSMKTRQSGKVAQHFTSTLLPHSRQKRSERQHHQELGGISKIGTPKVLSPLRTNCEDHQWSQASLADILRVQPFGEWRLDFELTNRSSNRRYSKVRLNSSDGGSSDWIDLRPVISVHVDINFCHTTMERKWSLPKETALYCDASDGWLIGCELLKI